MVIILIGIIVGFIWGVIDSYLEGYSGWLLDGIVFGILKGISGALIGFIIAFIMPMDLQEKNYTLNIEALQDNNSISGKFFLGSGQIDGKMQYVFYYEENGYYRMMQVDYNLVQIKYSDGIPKVNVTEMILSDAFINYFTIPPPNYAKKSYIIEVPKGTIKNNYNLDAQ